MCATRSRVLSIRVPLLVVTMAGLMAGLVAGLARMGWNVPIGAGVGAVHGPLLVFGVFTALIGIERAAAFEARWTYAGPGAAVLTALALVSGMPDVASVLAVAGATGMAALNVAIVRRQASTPTWLMLLASLVLVASAIAWATGAPVPLLVPSWIAFFALTISSERLEISRFVSPPAWAVRALTLASLTLAVASVIAIASPRVALRITGSALVIVSAWLLRFDIARRLVRQTGLAQFTAVAVLSGSAWLGVAGLQIALTGLPVAGPLYDAALHAVFVGFVLTMVMAHAPIILPAIVGIAIPYHRVFFVPLALLQISLVVRVVADWSGAGAWRQWAGVANIGALLLFAASAFFSRFTKRKP